MISFKQMPFLLIALLFFNCSDSSNIGQKNVVSEIPGNINKSLLLELVNTQRAKGCKCGNTYYPPVGGLVWNPVLEKVSLGHSQDMARKNYFAHQAKDGSKTADRMERVGYDWQSYGENIYRTMGYVATEQQVIEAWIGSPGHCANIMGKNFKEMGVAEYDNYWTQVFGSQMLRR